MGSFFLKKPWAWIQCIFVFRVAVGTVVPSASSIIVRFQNGIDGEIRNWRTRKLQYVPLSRGGVTS